MPSQTLPGFQQDGRARRQAEESYRHLKESKSGAEAVTAARSSQELRDADSLWKRTEGEKTVKPRYVQGKAFFRRGSQWIDGEVQSQVGVSRRRIRFGSDDYLDLLRRRPGAQAWLSLGQEVLLVLDGEVLEVFD
jgi:hypothetical protein